VLKLAHQLLHAGMQRRLLLARLLIHLFIMLRVAQRAGEHHGRRKLESGEKADDAEDPGQQAKLRRGKTAKISPQNLI